MPKHGRKGGNVKRTKSTHCKNAPDEIGKATRRADKLGMRACFRLNLTSDIPFEAKVNQVDGKSVFQHFPDFQFYDYTKGLKRAVNNCIDNYHLTFSRAESNGDAVKIAMQAGLNIATVFRGSLPKRWKGLEVINGDERLGIGGEHFMLAPLPYENFNND
jgi:hypothetical protein